MSVLKIGRKEYRDKVLACWLGKSIGGTLGTPWEGLHHTHAFSFYEPVPKTPLPNDDLDIQLVWLKMLEDQGLDPSVRIFAEYWDKYAKKYPFSEYGFFMRNYERGLRPPVAGCFENSCTDNMGSPIRSEIWACLYPGDPDGAARMAWKDSCIDHSGGEGMYGEMFWAAAEAAAFVEKDLHTLIRIGLNMIPCSSRLGRAIREAMWCYENGLSWGATREKIHRTFGDLRPSHAVPNHGFEIIGLLYGKDFGDCLCKAVNCGYDTDCTGATLGALLGIIGGTAVIPDRWLKPIGEEIVLHKFTGQCDAPKNVRELTERVVRLAEKSVAESTKAAFGDKTELPPDLLTRLFANDQAMNVLKQDIHSGVELLDGREVRFHYGGEPVLWPGIGRKVWVEIEGDDGMKVNLNVPAGWECSNLGGNVFVLYSEKAVAARNKIKVVLGTKKVEFMILGPAEARGFASGTIVPTCSKCGARVEACMCKLTEVAEKNRK